MEEVDALVKAHDDDTHQRGGEGGKKNGHKHIGRLSSTELGTIDQDADRDDGESRGVEHEEHNHRIGGSLVEPCHFLRRPSMLLSQCFISLLVQFLHTLHRLESQRGGCIVQTQHVGSNVHKDMSCGWMSLGNGWEKTCKERAEHP